MVKKGQGDDVRRLGALGARRRHGPPARAASTGTASRPPVTSARWAEPARPPPSAPSSPGCPSRRCRARPTTTGSSRPTPTSSTTTPTSCCTSATTSTSTACPRRPATARPPSPRIVRRGADDAARVARHPCALQAGPDLQEAHRLLPFVLTWDDHEYWNDYAGSSRHPPRTAGTCRPERAAAYQAYWEHQPLRAAARFKSGDPALPPAGVRQPAPGRHDRRPAVPVGAAVRLGRGAGVRGGVRPGDHDARHRRRSSGCTPGSRLGCALERLRQQRDDGAARPRRRRSATCSGTTRGTASRPRATGCSTRSWRATCATRSS